MEKFKVVTPGNIAYQQTTWEGIVDFEGEEITWRYSEDDNGSEFWTLEEGNWSRNDLKDPKHIAIYAAIMEYGNPEDFEEGEEIEIDQETLDMYS